jgi:hypothetical protein
MDHRAKRIRSGTRVQHISDAPCWHRGSFAKSLLGTLTRWAAKSMSCAAIEVQVGSLRALDARIGAHAIYPWQRLILTVSRRAKAKWRPDHSLRNWPFLTKGGSDDLVRSTCYATIEIYARQ